MNSLPKKQKPTAEQTCPACEFSTVESTGSEKFVQDLGNGKYECNVCGSIWKTIANDADSSRFPSVQPLDGAVDQTLSALRFPQPYDAKLGANSSFANFTSREPKGKKAALGLGAQVILAGSLTFSIGFGLLNLDRLSSPFSLKQTGASIDPTMVGSIISDRGLQLSDVAINQAQTSATSVWIITGKIYNASKRRLSVPALKMKNGGKLVQGWRYQPSRRMLGSGESFSFKIALAAIAQEEKGLSLHFDERN